MPLIIMHERGFPKTGSREFTHLSQFCLIRYKIITGNDKGCFELKMDPDLLLREGGLHQHALIFLQQTGLNSKDPIFPVVIV